MLTPSSKHECPKPIFFPERENNNSYDDKVELVAAQYVCVICREVSRPRIFSFSRMERTAKDQRNAHAISRGFSVALQREGERERGKDRGLELGKDTLLSLLGRKNERPEESIRATLHCRRSSLNLAPCPRLPVPSPSP
jgi:hypothetical protein